MFRTKCVVVRAARKDQRFALKPLRSVHRTRVEGHAGKQQQRYGGGPLGTQVRDGVQQRHVAPADGRVGDARKEGHHGDKRQIAGDLVQQRQHHQGAHEGQVRAGGVAVGTAGLLYHQPEAQRGADLHAHPQHKGKHSVCKRW